MSQTATATRADATASGQPAIVLDGVNKWYGAMHVLRDVSMVIGQGERIVVCGPSGSGQIDDDPLHQPA